MSTAEGLGSEGRWVVDRLLRELHQFGREIAEVERRLAQVTAEGPVIAQWVTLPGSDR